jgi:DNA repair protein RadA/Sms
MKKTSTIYLCESCGNEFSVWSGKCSACGEWNTLKELKIDNSKLKAGAKADHKVEISPLSKIEVKDNPRLKTGISELDRVLGGGIVPGSIILLGGEPGIGKSTILIEVANRIDDTFYNSAEESSSQIKLRASRLGLNNDKVMLAAEPDIDAVLLEAKKMQPSLLIVDSIQTVFTTAYDSTPGSIVQVRECGILLQQFAKTTGVPVIIVGHVTKEGNLAGPRILEHLVDTVLYLEGERFSEARILRSVKNRFGATNEVGIFTMTEEGLKEITNPSEIFLADRMANPGSVVTVTLEGTRPILVEIQALVMPTNFGYPKRTSSGFDLNRLNLLAAVVTKKTPANLSNYDIYLNVIGGLKLREPAVDLAVCAAIISSFKNKSFAKDLVFFGEVGLLGEVRKVNKAMIREKETKTLGYAHKEYKNLGEIFGDL